MLILIRHFLFIFLVGMTNSYAAIESADYHVVKGFLHKGGSARIEITEKDDGKFSAKMSYEIKKRALVPIPKKVLSGETVILLPSEFKDQKGYMELEKLGSMDTEKAKLEFVKKVVWNGKEDAYDILILPHNGKSKIEVIYHPSLPAAGWGKVVITFISPYPILNGYHAVIELN